MKLTSGVLFWPTTYSPSQKEIEKYIPLYEDIVCDFAIVGSGDSGSLCAYLLSELGAKVVLLEKRKIANGSTSANTGLLQFMNDKPLHSFIYSFGKEKAVRHYQLCFEAINGLEKISNKLDINSDFIKRSSLYYASDLEGKDLLEKEYEVLSENGFKAELFNKTKIKQKFNFNKELALYSRNDAEFNPYKFANGLIQYANNHNVKVFTETKVTRIIGTNDGVQLFTYNKHSVKAKKVIFAGGYESMEVRKEKNAILSSTFAIATQPILDHNNAWFEKCLIWETARPYLYIRSTVDGRIIIGGLDEPTVLQEKRESMLHHKKLKLLERLVELFPQFKEANAEYYWTGAFGGTHTGLPMIRQYKAYPNCYFLMGYGGNGTIYSYILANIFKDFVSGVSNPDAPLYLDNLSE